MFGRCFHVLPRIMNLTQSRYLSSGGPSCSGPCELESLVCVVSRAPNAAETIFAEGDSESPWRLCVLSVLLQHKSVPHHRCNHSSPCWLLQYTRVRCLLAFLRLSRGYNHALGRIGTEHIKPTSLSENALRTGKAGARDPLTAVYAWEVQDM